MVLDKKPILSYRKKMVLNQKAQPFPRKNQKSIKTHFCETIRPNSKMVLFLFSPRKKLVFDGKTKFLLGEKVGLLV